MLATVRVQAFMRSVAFTMAIFSVTRSASALHQDDASTFPKPPVVRKQVRFWEKIFYKYPSTTSVIHDSVDIDRIIDVIDFKQIGNDKPEGVITRKKRDIISLAYIKRYNTGLERFQRFGEEAQKLGAIEKRLWSVFSTSPASLSRLLQGKIKIRAQSGLADEFRRAANTASIYLPHMEKVFAQYSLPTALTRLPFVESMFNLRARSKVGASGIWQFMPVTAKLFIYVNDLVDERNSPFKATRAAAQLLSLNYRELQSWPLAITAYNHGTSGMQRAIHQVGNSDIELIIKNYESESFGFASRNFYSEFLAAYATYYRMERSGELAKSKPIDDSESLIIEKPISISQMISSTPITRDILELYNPCIRNAAYHELINKPLPPFYEIRLPRNLSKVTKAAIDNLTTKKYAKR